MDLDALCRTTIRRESLELADGWAKKRSGGFISELCLRSVYNSFMIISFSLEVGSLVHSISEACHNFEIASKAGLLMSCILSGSCAGLGQVLRLRLELCDCIRSLLHRTLSEVKLNLNIRRRVSAA